MILRTFSIAFWFFSFLRFSSIRSQIHTVVYDLCICCVRICMRMCVRVRVANVWYRLSHNTTTNAELL